MVISAFLYLSTKFQGFKKRFYEICYFYIIDYTFAQSFVQFISQIIRLAVYILLKSEEGYSLTWKAKSLAIQTDKGK